ncbi:protein spaetzle 4-like [Panonychus citri]|uniref:protein spaetzle 4-like n=1 Tax=Panonychus citri TaxID=50023 RepID=UPI002306FAF2|nr:protein spaetzle 4-like [Panonychus citri]
MMLTPILIQVIVTLLINFLSLVVTQSTCGPKVSARLLMDIPCDMSKTNFCELSGTIYPWSAVRRYIYENQGLLRRMYGDQRHYSIVTNEMHEANEKYDNIFIYDQETKFFESNQINHQSPYAVKYQPQFRPRAFFMDESDEDESVTSSSSSSSPSTSTTIVNQQTNSSESSNNNLNFNDQLTSNNNGTIDKIFMLKESENNTRQESTTSKPESSSTTIINDQSSSSESDYSDSGVTVKSEDEATESPSDQNDEMTKQVDKVLHMIEANDQQESSESSTSSQSETLQTSSQPQSTSSPTQPQPQPQQTTTTTPMSTIEAHSPHPTNNNNNNEQSPPPALPKQPTAPMETDTAPKGKGVNACPVKEEVVAPYWANNTRGEILALLNVYPFEQYVHWEKCAHENSQMFCRDGCRCEQQYRLHRLLAFDPKNECRGIFADWFRFPSCCVCICYDLPETNLFYRSNKRKSRL